MNPINCVLGYYKVGIHTLVMSIYSENKQAVMELREGVLFFTFKSNTVLDQESAKTIVKERLLFQERKVYPVFCNISGVQSLDNSALKFLFHEGIVYIKALSLFSDIPLAARIGEFYLRTNPIAIPCRFFTNRMHAITFLKPYK